MKKLVIFSVFFICVYRVCTLECYSCNDNAKDDDCDSQIITGNSHKAIERCNSYQNYCGIFYYKNKPDGISCGDKDTCTQKGCATEVYCKEEGIFELYDERTDTTYTVECCKEHLCNKYKNYDETETYLIVVIILLSCFCFLMFFYLCIKKFFIK